ncbi:PQQ-dependent sugar dehydrogenase [Nocardioides speluncae]|uniref:PQQ-dependent sugar dehydrogenase n=1 Tax=Nocardioides speluncae TaxID=2670337 RepID=UPI000D68C5C7|nr:PQQ-dependent sugar dehydrogenase [Nocardioides speluncae]
MQKSAWWAAATTAALAAALLAPITSAQSSPAQGSLSPAPAAAEGEPIPDPIPEAPKKSSLGLVLKEYHQFPQTEPTPAPTDHRLMRRARINYIGDVPDGSRRQYVPDLNGPLYLLDRGQRHVYLDVKAQFPDFFSGRGMGSGFGFATFDPDFERNGKFYTVHTEKFADLSTKPATYPAQANQFIQGVVTEWTASDPDANSFSGTSREILRLGFGTQIHGIQQIDFNPTASRYDEDYGLLYVAVGDGGRGVGTVVPQERHTPYGKILRIDPDGTNGPNGEYGIPSSNPFVGDEGTIGEIYALGMRDPHRFAWDSGGQNRMYLGHIGQHAIEGVYEIRAGDNIGWSTVEGRFVYDPTDECNLYPLPANHEEWGYTYPVAAFDHDPPPGWPCSSDSGHGISGGQVYRGDLPGLRGKYVFGDLVDGRIFWTEASEMRQETGREATLHEMQLWDTNGKRLRMTDFAEDARVDVRFGVDGRKNLYFLAKSNGKVWKVVGTRHAPAQNEVTPEVRENLVSYYDFEHPFPVVQHDDIEADLGSSETLFNLVNGRKESRVRDGAFPGSNSSIQTQQVNPEVAGNDDWKAGVWNANGVRSLEAFRGVEQATVMGWFKMTGTNPNLNSNTPDPTDRFNAVGLAGILSGNSDGHGVRALLELINVNGELRLVALGRRIDEGASQTFAASQDWQTLLPQGKWVHLAATFDYTTGEMALYRNGKPLDGFYVAPGDPWQVDGTGTSPTLPRGYKIGGSYPQNTREQNPCNCRFDSLMFLDHAASAEEVSDQFRRFLK